MKKLNLLFFLIGTIAMVFVMSKTGAALKTIATPKGIIDLEFAYNVAKSNIVTSAWQQTENIKTAKINTYWDFLFIFFYSGFLFLACKRIALNSKPQFAKVGNLVAKGALLAGVFDILENAGMLLSLNNQVTTIIAFFTTFFSVIKWSLVILAIIYLIVGLPVLGIGLLQKRNNK